MLTREDIRKIDTKATTRKVIEVPQWGGSVKIRPMTVVQQERFWDILDDIARGVPIPAGKRGSVVMMCTEKEDGSPLFTAQDAEWLGDGANIDAVQLIHKAIMALSGITQEEQAEIEKKPETQTSSSSTGVLTDGASLT